MVVAVCLFSHPERGKGKGKEFHLLHKERVKVAGRGQIFFAFFALNFEVSTRPCTFKMDPIAVMRLKTSTFFFLGSEETRALPSKSI